MVHKGRIKRIPTPEVKAVDAVGAGDAFVGTLAASWSEVAAAERAKSHDAFRLAEQAVLRASAAGAIAATRPGAIPSMPRRDEVIALAATLRAGG
jgi:ribokinase